MSATRILVAGIGNIFLGDDAFGVEVVQRMLRRVQADEVRVFDFGIRGLDLVYALLDGYETVILIDAAPRGGNPGDLYVLEIPAPADAASAASDAAPPMIETHDLNPESVLRLAAWMGSAVQRMFLVGCEPTPLDEGRDAPGLSPPVQAALPQALELVDRLVADVLSGVSAANCDSAATGKAATDAPRFDAAPCKLGGSLP